MALWDSATLLATCQRLARRPAVDESYSSIEWYLSLTNGEAKAIGDLSARAPASMFGAPALMLTADGGKTYTLPVDEDGTAPFALGHAEIYSTLEAIPDDPLIPGIDFLAEARAIRMLNNTARTTAPYARYVIEPGTISATLQPRLYPKSARMMDVYAALAEWASRPGSGADPTYWTKLYEQEFSRVLLQYRAQWNMAAAQMPNAINLSRRASARFMLLRGRF